MISGKELKSLIPTILKKSGKVNFALQNNKTKCIQTRHDNRW